MRNEVSDSGYFMLGESDVLFDFNRFREGGECSGTVTYNKIILSSKPMSSGGMIHTGPFPRSNNQIAIPLSILDTFLVNEASFERSELFVDGKNSLGGFHDPTDWCRNMFRGMSLSLGLV